MKSDFILGESTTDHQLINISQDSKESPQNFLSNAIEIKDRLLLSPKEVGEKEIFGTDLAQRKFLKSVGTGEHQIPI